MLVMMGSSKGDNIMIRACSRGYFDERVPYQPLQQRPLPACGAVAEREVVEFDESVGRYDVWNGQPAARPGCIAQGSDRMGVVHVDDVGRKVPKPLFDVRAPRHRGHRPRRQASDG